LRVIPEGWLSVTGCFDLAPVGRIDIVRTSADVHVDVVLHDRFGRSMVDYVDGSWLDLAPFEVVIGAAEPRAHATLARRAEGVGVLGRPSETRVWKLVVEGPDIGGRTGAVRASKVRSGKVCCRSWMMIRPS